MSVWEEITVGNGPFGVVVIPVVVPGGTSPVYRITGPQPIGGAIIESGRERAVEIAAELNRLHHEPLDVVWLRCLGCRRRFTVAGTDPAPIGGLGSCRYCGGQIVHIVTRPRPGAIGP